MEIWEPKPPGTLWATLGLLRDPFTLPFTFNMHQYKQSSRQHSVFYTHCAAY